MCIKSFCAENASTNTKSAHCRAGGPSAEGPSERAQHMGPSQSPQTAQAHGLLPLTWAKPTPRAWAHGCSMGWASLRFPPRPPPSPWAPPAPPRVNLLTRSLRELTRSLRGGLCSVPKGRKAIATDVPQRGPGEEGQVQRGPGGLFRWRGTAEGSNTLLVSILLELMFFAGFPSLVIFPVAYSLLPAA
jgi:hypothetical protein